ncbi:MAG TPA: ThiF family adenylyltransferase, partial [Polyangiaceae bacterium]|nr:ThiF family adenylyltransferase [Polyangiaceae bacterium]
GQAQLLDASVMARTYSVVLDDGGDDGAIFNYVDTASTKAEIAAIASKLELAKIVIVGLGGTGSYVLDLIAKTPVRAIHIYDGDVFLQKNAFRAPGAPSIEELQAKPKKAHYLRDIYSHMHRGIVAHDVYVEGEVIEQLRDASFVFICVDRGSARKAISLKLEAFGIPFVDVGMGIQVGDGALFGVVRATTSTSTRRDHFSRHVSFADDEVENEYNRNIQVADLNALNAALAVVKWKKLFGFYADLEREHHCTYTIDGNFTTNEEKA